MSGSRVLCRLLAAGFLMLLCATGLFAPVALASPAVFDADADYVADDPKVCLMCHGAGSGMPADDVMHGVHGVVGNDASPFAEGQLGCQACHGPSADHLGRQDDGSRPLPAVVFDDRHSVEKRDAVCLSCHTREAGTHWEGSLHEFGQVSCTGCHNVHGEADSASTAAGRTDQCLTCHRQQRAEMQQASSHPLRSGQMHCTDCHNPHGGPGPFMMPEHTLNDQCYQCHAEKRGPFLWEHAPVAEDCSHCHRPHGSNHRDLLQARTPWLCQECHMAPFHPSSAESGMGLPPNGASSNLMAKDCSNCHTQVHGSNHPSGSGLTR
ncbi:DmsE family decaheme c-type cytochrome [Marinimicrobium locisalis]|uniref:DmsE family decaheme c-type cytochrome n=1 Tax=Marinimicrobium locisalis TaxID=546022 RepID=UPI0032215B8B